MELGASIRSGEAPVDGRTRMVAIGLPGADLAGDLVFAGEPNGNFNAFHARTGELLWQFNTGSGGWVEGYAPEMYGAPRGNALVVFALP